MVEHDRVHADSDLTLRWHRGAASLPFEAFQPWALALLQAAIRFDGALWGFAAERIDDSLAPPDAVHRFGSLRLDASPAATDDAVPSEVWRNGATRSADAQISPRQAPADIEAGRKLCVRSADGESGGQFIMLARAEDSPRFDAQEGVRFERIAQHLMQAYATGRKLYRCEPRDGRAGALRWSAAIISRNGMLHDHDARFVPLLREEWPGWPGRRLPDVLLELAARRSGTPWRFLGEQITADFAPVHDFYLVTARPRLAGDLLTARERHVAERYGEGKNYKEIAEAMQLSPATVRSHLRNVFAKLKVRNKAQLAALLR